MPPARDTEQGRDVVNTAGNQQANALFLQIRLALQQATRHLVDPIMQIGVCPFARRGMQRDTGIVEPERRKTALILLTAFVHSCVFLVWQLTLFRRVHER